MKRKVITHKPKKPSAKNKSLLRFFLYVVIFLLHISRSGAQTLNASGSINEGAENNATIVVSLSNTGDTVKFVDTPDIAHWTLNNGPQGVTIGSLNLDDSVTVTITLLGNRTRDYDSDITGASITVLADDLIKHASDLTSSGGILFDRDNSESSEDISVSWKNPPGDEDNITSEVLVVTIIDGTFDQLQLNGNVTLSGTAYDEGVRIASITYNNPTEIEINLDYTGLDFDIDKSLTVTIAGDAYDQGTSNLTDNITVTANPDGESIVLSWKNPEPPNGYETSLNGEVVTVSISGGNFVTGVINTANVSLAGEAAVQGVEIQSFDNITATSFDIILTYDGTDFDNDLDLEVWIDQNAYEDNNSGGDLSNTITITSYNDSESISLNWVSPPGDEDNLDNEIIEVTLNGGTLIQSEVTSDNINLSGNAVSQGVTAGTVSYINQTTFEIDLNYSGPDFDSPKTLTLELYGAAYNEGTDTLVNNIAISENNDDESITLSWPDHLGLNANEATLSGDILTVIISGGTFLTSQINTTNISLSGSITTDADVGIGSFDNITTNSFDIILDYGDKDFDNDKNLSVLVEGAAYDDGSGVLTSPAENIDAVIEPAQITVLPHSITEKSENNDSIKVSMIEDIFVSGQINTTNISVLNLPEGVSVGNVLYVDTNRINIVLSGTRIFDFDTDYNFTVQVLPVSLNVYTDTIYAISGIHAVDDEENLILTGYIEESAEDGDSVIVYLDGGTFIQNLNFAQWSFSNLPEGVSADTIVRVDDTTAILILQGNRISDYDQDILNFSVTADDSQIDDHTGTNISSNTGVTFKAYNDPESLLSNINSNYEDNLDNAIISVTLNGGTLIQPDVETNVNLIMPGADIGLSIDSVTDITSNTFNLHLAWDSTDFDNSRQLIISLNNSAYNDGDQPIYDTIILVANDDIEEIFVSWDASAGNNGFEPGLNTEVIDVSLIGGSFITSDINSTNIKLGNEAIQTGINIQSFTDISRTGFKISLSWDSTDFDTDKLISVNVAGNAYNDGTDTLKKNIVVTAVDEQVRFGRNLYSEEVFSLGTDSIDLIIRGAQWIGPNGSNGAIVNDFKSTTADILFDGISFTNGPDPDDRDDLVNGFKNETSGGDNDVLRWINDTVLRIFLPENSEFNVIGGNLELSFYIDNSLIKGTKGNETVVTNLEIREIAALSGSLAGGGKICYGDSSRITIILGGMPPWDVTYFNTSGDTIKIDSLNFNIYEFYSSDTGSYKLYSVSDRFFTINELNPNIYNNNVSIFYYEMDPVSISPSIKTIHSYKNIEYNLKPYGIPSGGRFSGPGVYYDTIFNSLIAQVNKEGYPHKIVYSYTNKNGCSDSDTVNFDVITGGSTIEIKENICWYDKPILVTAGNNYDVPGLFSISNKIIVGSEAVNISDFDTAVIYPSLHKEGKDVLYYHYSFGGNDFVDSVIYNIEYIDSIKLKKHDNILCNNTSPFIIEGDHNETGADVVNRFIWRGDTSDVDKFLFDPSQVITDGDTLFYEVHHNECFMDTFEVIKVYESPDPEFELASSCIPRDSTIHFINLTDTTLGSLQWEWYLVDEDQVTSTDFEPDAKFWNAEFRWMFLKALKEYTDKTCVAWDSVPASLYDSPRASFNTGAGCYQESQETVFENGYKDFNSLTDIATWKIKDFGFVSQSKNLLYTFDSAGYYNIELLIENEHNCRDSVKNIVYLRPTLNVGDISFPYYQEDFNTKTLWTKDSDTTLNNWIWENPIFDEISEAGNKAWFTLLPDSTVQEISWVESPCFNITALERPMIKLDIWRSFFSNNEGSVLQYLSGSNQWITLGDIDEGLNWYNSSDIDGQPGFSKTGWTGKSGELTIDSSWVSARHNLNDIENKSNVRFRISYGTEGEKEELSKGFAFDNVWIGDRNKNVLLEYFTNTGLTESTVANNIVNNIISSDDFVILQYHTPYPKNDPLFLDNSSDLSTRFMYYKSIEVPRSIMDGGIEGKNWVENFDNPEKNTIENDMISRSLDDSKFKIDISKSYINSNELIVESNITPVSDLDEMELYAFVVIYEEEVALNIEGSPKTIYKNVVRKLLPDAAGLYFGKSWEKDVPEIIQQKWTLSDQITDPSQLWLAVFIQDVKTNEVYQVQKSKILNYDPTFVNSENFISGIDVYPNPGNGYFKVIMSDQMPLVFNINVINQLGQVVYTMNNLKSDINCMVNLTQLKNGIYFMNINGKYFSECKKIIIQK